jgi:hypothetical protein
VSDNVDPGGPLDDAGPGGDVGDTVSDNLDGGPTDDTASGGGDVGDTVSDNLDGGPTDDTASGGGDVGDTVVDKVLPPPKPAPRTYTAKGINFEPSDESGTTPVKFADPSYITDINYVVAFMKKNPQVQVKIEAYVGITGHQPGRPTGRTEEVRKVWGGLMDARARAVQDVMVRNGIPVERIHLSRGAAEVGEAGRRVEFHFTRK